MNSLMNFVDSSVEWTKKHSILLWRVCRLLGSVLWDWRTDRQEDVVWRLYRDCDEYDLPPHMFDSIRRGEADVIAGRVGKHTWDEFKESLENG